MSTLCERMNLALDEVRKKDPSKSKTGLAKACNVRAASVSDWFSGKTKSLSFESAVAAAMYLDVSTVWLASGEGEMHSRTVEAFDEYDEFDDDEFVEIPEYRASCSAGPGCPVIYEEISDSIKARYRRSWFQARGINPNNCKRFKVHGTSMEPFLWDGDTILVDCSPQDVISGKTYAFMLYGEMRVKVLYPLLLGLLVRSLNPDVPDEKLNHEELETFILIGRVRDRSGDGML